MEITLEISMAAVLREVAQKSEYTGAKLEGDEKAYNRIRVVDEDHPELKMFWDECRAELLKIVVGCLVRDEMDEEGDVYRLTLDMWDGFKTAVVPGMVVDLFNYYVYGIIARWYAYVHKDEAVAYANVSAMHLDGLSQSITRRAYLREMYPY